MMLTICNSIHEKNALTPKFAAIVATIKALFFVAFVLYILNIQSSFLLALMHSAQASSTNNDNRKANTVSETRLRIKERIT